MKPTPKQQREYEQNQKAMREAAQQLRTVQGSLKSPSMITSVDGLGTRTELTTEQQREYEQNQVAQQKAREELLKHGSYKSMTSPQKPVSRSEQLKKRKILADFVDQLVVRESQPRKPESAQVKPQQKPPTK